MASIDVPGSSFSDETEALRSTQRPLSQTATKQFKFSGIVEILVGKSETKFHAHFSTLVAAGQFFQAALSDKWLEGKVNTIRFPEDEPEVIERFLEWCYDLRIDTATRTAYGQLDIVPHIKLYAFADKVGAEDCMKAIIEALHWDFQHEVVFLLDMRLFELLSVSATALHNLRDLILDFMAVQISPDGTLVEELHDKFPSLALAFTRRLLERAIDSSLIRRMPVAQYLPC